MIFKSNKGISTHVGVLLFTSVLISGLLFLVIDTVYVPDLPQCELLDFEFEKVCKTSKGVDFTVVNDGDLSVSLMFNSNENFIRQISSRQTKSISVSTKEDSLEVVPVISKDGNLYQCRMFKESMEVNLLKKC